MWTRKPLVSLVTIIALCALLMAAVTQINLATQAVGLLSTAHGGTNVNSTAVFPSSGTVLATTTGYASLTSVQASLTGSNVTMTSLSTFYDGPTTGSIAAGTWFVSGYVTLGKASATGQSLDQCKLWDGTTTFATAQTSVPYVTTAAITYAEIYLNAVITEASGSTIKISCESSVAGGIIYYITPTGSLINASSISAVRIQ